MHNAAVTRSQVLKSIIASQQSMQSYINNQSAVNDPQALENLEVTINQINHYEGSGFKSSHSKFKKSMTYVEDFQGFATP